MKRRDAGTGQYISEETAKSMPENTWVTERSFTENIENHNQLLLKLVYNRLLAYAGYSECEDFESVKVENITKVFKEAGLDVDS